MQILKNSISGYLSAINYNKNDPKPDPVPPANELMKKNASTYPASSSSVSTFLINSDCIDGPCTLYPYAQLLPDPSYFVKLNSPNIKKIIMLHLS